MNYETALKVVKAESKEETAERIVELYNLLKMYEDKMVLYESVQNSMHNSITNCMRLQNIIKRQYPGVFKYD